MVDGGSGAIYVSYAPSDLAWAEWIGWQLEAAGFVVTVGDWDFVPGKNLVAASDKALTEELDLATGFGRTTTTPFGQRIGADDLARLLAGLRRELRSAHRWTYPYEVVLAGVPQGVAADNRRVAPTRLPSEVLAITGLQRDVLRRLADGYTEDEIADATTYSPVEVRRQLRQAMRRLGILPHDDGVSQLWCALFLFGRHQYPDLARRRVSMRRADLM